MLIAEFGAMATTQCVVAIMIGFDGMHTSMDKSWFFVCLKLGNLGTRNGDRQ